MNFRYQSGHVPRVGDRVRLVDVEKLWTQLDEPAECGEYDVDDISWGQLLLVSNSAAIWCDPGRVVKAEAAARQIVEGE